MSAAGEPENRATSTVKNENKELSRLQFLGKLPLQNQANDESAKERTLDSNWRIGNKSAEENKEERPSDRNWRTTKVSRDRKNPDIKNQAHKKQQRDSFTVTGLLCQVYCKGSDKWFYVKVEDEPLTNERLKCYFRFLSDPSVPLIEYKTKFLLGVKFVSDYDEQPQTEQRIKVLWVNPLEYIKLTSSDVLEAFKNLPLIMTHEEIIQKFYFTWRKYLMALLSQAHQFDEQALTEILYFILPDDDESCRVVQAQEHHCRFQEIIKLLSSRESNFLQRLNQFDFIGNEELVKKLIELVATANNSLDPVCHLLRRYYDDDMEGLLNLIEKCCKGFDTSLNSLAAQNFRDIPLIPVMEELKGVISAKVFGVSLNPTVQRLLQLESHLLPNRTVGPWKSPEEFLNVHFRLLREECFASIRDRIARVRSEPTNDQLVHRDVKLVSYAIGEGSIVVKIKFKPSKIRANLMFGNLLCLDVDTDFSNPIWATVKSANRGSEISISLVGVGNNYISGNYIDGLDGSPSARIVIPALQRLIATQSGVMVESPTYYHAFRPVLARLQTLTSSDFPFASEILVQSKEPQPSPIKFVTTSNFPGLDDSQRVAAEAALKNRFSLIQGPPGCGKTFVGKEIVRTMLNSVHFVEKEETDEDEDGDEDEFGILQLKSNSKSSVKEPKGPILVISYKNHALDSFLENCLKFTKNNSEPLSLARIGGRSTSEAIAKFDLHNQTQEMKNYFSKEKFMKLQDARTQLHDFAEKVEKMAAKSLISFTPSALIDFLLREQGTNGKQQLYSLMVRNFTENYRKIIRQENYECDSPEEAVTDILNDLRTAEKILKSALEQWLSERESEKYLPKPQTSLFINTSQHKTIKDEDDDAEDDEEIEEDEWEEVVAERFVGSESKLKFNDILHKNVKIYQKLQKRLENLEPDVREQEVCGVSDVWSLTYEGRYVLLSYWLREWRKEMDENLAEALDEYSNFYRQVQVLEQERNVEFLKSRDLIACTITGCCLRMGVIARVAPSIVIVEEAAEILESQLIAALPSSVKHVVLVGDHQQLPPQVHHYRLKTKFNLGISIFERLANNGYPVSQLRFHRRGPQSLCPLFARFYKQEIVATKKDPLPPPILARMGLFYWWTHEAPAQLSPNGTSFENEFEGAMLVGAIHLLIKIGRIDASKITVITGYLGQSKKIKQMLEKDEIQGVKVCTIDRYQGDENDFIFLSLTRSVSEKTDCEPSLGFLASPNRTCVALSRARKGLYVFGCSSLFQYHPTWCEIVQYFRGKKNKLGHELTFNVSGKLLTFEHPNDFSLFFKDLQLQEQAMRHKLHKLLSKELPELNPGIHDVTAEFGWKMENLMNNTVLDKRDLGVGRDGDKKKYSGFKVTKVQRIFNKDMYLTYLHHLKRIEDSKPPPLGFEVDTKTDWMVSDLKLNKRANEVFLFHGTKRDIVDIIAEGGFDERVASKGMFGAGIYFAENADKSDQYTDRSVERFIFLARVTLGNPKKMLKSDNQLRRPPPIDPKKPNTLYDSVIAVSSRKSGLAAAVARHQEFIIFDRYHCLPEFIIHYCRIY